jgi:hypothetical protein
VSGGAAIAKLDASSAIEVYVDRARDLVDEAIRSGKLLPADRDDALNRARDNPLAFQAEIAGAPQVIPLGELGSDEDVPGEAIEMAPPGGLDDRARAVHLSEVSRRLFDVAEDLDGGRDYGFEGDKADLVADRDRWRLRTMAGYASHLAESLVDHLAESTKPFTEAARRFANTRRGGRPPGPSMRREKFVAEMTRAVAEVRRDGRRVTQKAVATQMDVPFDTFRDYLKPGDWPPT